MSKRAAQIEEEARWRASLMGPFGLGRPRKRVPAERHYLPFVAASSDWAYADHALDGIESGSDGWTLIVKVYGRPSVAANKCLASIYDEEVANIYTNLCYAYVSSANKISGEGLRGLPTNGLLYSKTLDDTTTTGVQVIAVKHRNAATQHYDVTIAKDGATLETFGGAFASNEDRSPVHLALAAYGLKTAGVHAAAGLAFLNMNVIAVAVVQGIASEAEIQAYSIADDARLIWAGDACWTYYPMSHADGAAVANLGAGSSAPLTLSGPVAADLVAL